MCSIFVLMMQGYSLTATLPEEFGLGERFWYWRGASGQSYIHSIYALDLCPPVAGAVFVIVRRTGGARSAIAVGRFGSDGGLPRTFSSLSAGDEIHVHLLVRDGEGAVRVQHDLEAALEERGAAWPEPKAWRKAVQLELLAA